MARVHNISPLILSLLTILSIIQAWTFSSTNINLLAPPPLNSGTEAENDQPLSNYIKSSWPCDGISVPSDVHRTPWPISGGRLTYNMTNSTVGSLSDSQYYIWAYLGQISLGGGTYSTASQTSGEPGYAYAETDVWGNFETGLQCSDPLDIAELISEALDKTVDEVKTSLEGLNATFGLRLVLFTPNPNLPYYHLDDYNMEEMYQCGYVTFTSADVSNSPDSGFCNGAGSSASSDSSSSASSGSASSASSDSSTSISSAVATATPASSATDVFLPTSLRTSKTPSHSLQSFTITTSSIPTNSIAASSNNTVAAGSGSHAHVAVRTGVSLSISATLVILALAFWFVRRRRERKASGTIGADIMVSRPLDGDVPMGGIAKEENWREKVVDSAANSIHSEPLPMYTSTTGISSHNLKHNVMERSDKI